MARKLWHALDPEAQNLVLSPEHMRAICAEARELERELEEIAEVLYGNKDILDSPGALPSAVRTLARSYADLYAEKNKAVLDERARCAPRVAVMTPRDLEAVALIAEDGADKLSRLAERVRAHRCDRLPVLLLAEVALKAYEAGSVLLQGTEIEFPAALQLGTAHEKAVAALAAIRNFRAGQEIPATASAGDLEAVAADIGAAVESMAEGELIAPSHRTMSYWIDTIRAHRCATQEPNPNA